MGRTGIQPLSSMKDNKKNHQILTTWHEILFDLGLFPQKYSYHRNGTCCTEAEIYTVSVCPGWEGRRGRGLCIDWHQTPPFVHFHFLPGIRRWKNDIVVKGLIAYTITLKLVGKQKTACLTNQIVCENKHNQSQAYVSFARTIGIRVCVYVCVCVCLCVLLKPAVSSSWQRGPAEGPGWRWG